MLRHDAPYLLGVFATPCSATHFTRIMLCEIGLDVGSEKEPRRDGQVAWTTALHPVGTFRIRLHQVRDPIRAISGIHIYGRHQYFRDEVRPRCGTRFDGQLTKWCAELWMRWNAYCDWRSYKTYRVEDIQHEFSAICEMLGVTDAVFPEVNPLENSKRQHYELLTQAQICNSLGRRRRQQFVDQVRRYGYDI